MTAEVFTGIAAFLSLMLLIVNLYLAVIQKPLDVQKASASNTERTMNEFLIAYAKEYTELKGKLESMETEIERLQTCNSDNMELFQKLTLDVQTCIFQLKALNDRLTEYINNRGGKLG
jgi:competence protein ComGF